MDRVSPDFRRTACAEPAKKSKLIKTFKALNMLQQRQITNTSYLKAGTEIRQVNIDDEIFIVRISDGDAFGLVEIFRAV